jgi:serpin B
MKSLVLLAATLLVAASCGKAPEVPVLPAKPIELTTRGGDKVAADNAFAFDFFRATLATVPEADRNNAFVSPLSLTMALGMLYNGTSEDAGKEMAAALGMENFTAGEINAHYQNLMKALLEADPQTALAIANSIWTREGFEIAKAFYDVNREFFNAEMQTRDFDDPETIRAINDWCAGNTAGRISGILDRIPPKTVIMYLINAVCFKGRWKSEFDKKNTRDEDFILAGGGTKKVKMMSQTTDLPVYGNTDFRCVELPYGNGAFSMMVFLPEGESSLDDLVAELDAEACDKAVEGLREGAVMLKLPRWKQECEFDLVEPMENLGVRRIFGNGSLAGINDDPRLAVSGIRQKTFVEVAEEGTEAAAVTVVEVEYTSAGPGSGPIPFIADRPFLYLIRERSTGAILFMGRMDDPSN